uniref:Uncharacterized protein n=1 Tax=Romanomermis culicivorax TaxID=13658 RepID=A0A915J2H2_ROMCU
MSGERRRNFAPVLACRTRFSHFIRHIERESHYGDDIAKERNYEQLKIRMITVEHNAILIYDLIRKKRIQKYQRLGGPINGSPKSATSP